MNYQKSHSTLYAQRRYTQPGTKCIRLKAEHAARDIVRTLESSTSSQEDSAYVLRQYTYCLKTYMMRTYALSLYTYMMVLSLQQC